MATIEFNKHLVYDRGFRFLVRGAGGNFQPHRFIVLSGTYCYFRLMTGTIPTQFSGTLTNVNVSTGSRAADIVTWVNLNTGIGQLVDNTANGGSVTTITSPGANGVVTYYPSTNTDIAYAEYTSGLYTSLGSGTVNWFWLSYSTNAATEIKKQFIGTVGTIGSGADLEMSSVSLNTGDAYRINKLRMKLPGTNSSKNLTFTY